jgi:single-strand DNA-binding protein
VNFCNLVVGGRLTRDTETTFTQAGMAIVKFGLAWDSGWGDKKKPVFLDVTMFGKRGEAFAKFHSKGDTALISGDLRYDTWDDKNTGQKRSKLYAVGNEWTFAGSKKDATQPVTGWGGDDAPPADEAGGPIDVDDTPF